MNVWIWGPPMWDTLHSAAFVYDSKKISMGPMLQSLQYLLPCIHCRNSYKEFFEDIGKPKVSGASVWVYEMHNKVNLKLWRQKFDNDNFIRPTLEVVAKRFLLKEEKISWNSVSTSLLAIIMYLESAPDLVNHFSVFVEGLKKAVTAQPNAKELLKILDELDQMSRGTQLGQIGQVAHIAQMRLYLEKVKYGETGPVIRARTELIRAGSCIKKTCV